MIDDDDFKGKSVEVVTINFTVRVVSDSRTDSIEKLSKLALSLLNDVRKLDGGDCKE